MSPLVKLVLKLLKAVSLAEHRARQRKDDEG